MDVWQALFSFWSSFGVPVYEENSVPDADEITFPYITYQAVRGGFGADTVASASIWTRSTSWLQADTLADAVLEKLGGRNGGGYVQRHDGGGIWITAEDNFAQNMGDPDDDMIKRKLLTVALRFS